MTNSRLQIGVDVPWVTSWSEEKPTRVSRCPSVDGLPAAGQEDKPGQGKPLYSRNHLFRQRKSVREMLCPMCGEPTEAPDRWSQTGHWTTAGAVREMGLGKWLPADFKDTRPLFDAGAIAPLHRACAERALTHCPHLKGMADRELKPFPEAWIVIPLTIEAKPPAALGGAQASVPVISFLQLIGVPGAVA